MSKEIKTKTGKMGEMETEKMGETGEKLKLEHTVVISMGMRFWRVP